MRTSFGVKSPAAWPLGSPTLLWGLPPGSIPPSPQGADWRKLPLDFGVGGGRESDHSEIHSEHSLLNKGVLSLLKRHYFTITLHNQLEFYQNLIDLEKVEHLNPTPSHLREKKTSWKPLWESQTKGIGSWKDRCNYWILECSLTNLTTLLQCQSSFCIITEDFK